MEKIDQITSAREDKLLIIARLFGFGIFEIVSYAFGLTKIRYRIYITYTAIFALIPSIILYFIFRDIDFGSISGILIWMLGIGVVGFVFVQILLRVYREESEEQMVE